MVAISGTSEMYIVPLDVCACMRIYFEQRVFAMFLPHSRNNAETEIVAQRVWARYIIHIYPNLISVSDPPAMMAFEGPLPPLPSHPCTLSRSVYCYVAFMHEPSRFYCYEHMTDYIGRGRERFVLSERKSVAAWMEMGFIGPKREGGKERKRERERAEIDGMVLSCRERVTFLPCAALESQITVTLVFLITRSLPKRFSGVFNSPVLTCNSRF